jgi:putative ABC transport system permease protein
MHLGVGLGVIVATAVLVGSLVVGDSIDASLKRLARQRTGRVALALDARDRTVRSALAESLGAELHAIVAPVLQLSAVGSRPTEDHSLPGVKLLGVDNRFWQLDQRAGLPLAPDSVVLSFALAQTLHAKLGETLVFRVEKPSPLPREAPLSTDVDAHVGLRLTVSAIAPEDSFARFSLQSEQHEALNALVPLASLQQAVGAPGRANLLLIGEGAGVTLEGAQAALRRHVELSDLALTLSQQPGGQELRSDRIFLEPPVVNVSRHGLDDGNEVFTYFVNELRVGDRAAPYSTVAALGSSTLPGFNRMHEGQVLIDNWLAEDLHAHTGDFLDLKFFVFGAGRTLQEKAARLSIAGIVPMQGDAADPSLMPEIPGLTDITNCRDWTPGIPLDHARIRDRDEAYWQQHRGTPKAFVRLSLAEKLWGNRYGDRTAIRYGVSTREEVEQVIRRDLDPATLGLSFVPVSRNVGAASDFGPLFLGFSFFLIVGALLLTALLFVFGIESRAEEIGTLRALGFTARRIRGLLLIEAAVVVLVGATLGALLGQFYTRVVLAALATIWRDAVGLTSLRYAVQDRTLIGGALIAVSVSFGSLWWALRRASSPAPPPTPLDQGGSRRQWSAVLAIVAVGLVALTAGGRDLVSAALFFIAGALLLLAGVLGSDGWLSAWHASEAPTLWKLARRNLARRRGRSIATVALLACGTFLIVAIGANRQDPKRVSGAGNIDLYAESTLPVLHDLDTPAGRAAVGLDESLFQGVRIYSLRVHDGDDASCLTPTQAVRPRLLGVKPFDLVDAGLVQAPMLEAQSRQEVSALGDNATVVWALHSREDGIIPYVDERGETLRLRLRQVVPDFIFQGSLIVPEEAFREHFPSESGYRVFLIDAPADRIGAVSTALSVGLLDAGFTMTPAWKRLAQFHAVENTYLAIFQALGALGLLLGCVGVGVLVLRHVMERQAELALLSALGFSRRRVRWLVLLEHLLLLALGLGTGTLAAFVAVVPALRSPGAQVPVGMLVLTLAIVIAGAVAAVAIATRIALRRPLTEALQRE